MAVTTLLEKWASNPDNIESIRDAINKTSFDDESMPKFKKFVNVTNAKPDAPIALLGEHSDVGESGFGCNPTYKKASIDHDLKRWTLGDWRVPEYVCVDEIVGTMVEYALNTGTQVENLTDTEIGTVYTDLLGKAIIRMIWRYAWFGDKAANTVSSGGVLKDGTDTKMFDTCDGLFKRIFDQMTENEEQLVSIEANTKESYAEQKSTMLAEGAATGVMDDLLMNADSRITSDSNAVVLMTKAFADALKRDIKNKYKDNMEWTTIFDGFEMAKYEGVNIARVDVWDRIIKAYENTGSKLNKPYRLVYTNPRNLLVGTNANNLVSNLEIWFDKKERNNYWYAAGKIGTQLLEENLIMAAY